MKVSVKESTFKPIELILETEEEAILIKTFLASLSGICASDILGYNYDCWHMYDSLNEVTPMLDVQTITISHH